MSLMSTVIVTTMKNNYRSKAAIITFFLMALIFSLILVTLGMLFFIIPELQKDAPDIDKISNILGLIVYITCLCCLGINMNIFSARPLVQEKAEKTLESLLATPISAKQVWIARSLAVYIPSLIMAELFAISYFLVINYVFIVPKVGFLITSWMVFNGFLLLPLLYFFLNLLVHIVALIGNPISGNVIAQTSFPAIGSLMINLGVRHIWKTTTWVFTFINLIVIITAVVFVLLHQSSVTKEKITISVK